MKIGLYFGSFNPIHIGHLIIANYIAQNTQIEQVWLVVSPQNPLKITNTLLNEYQRLHLAQLAVEQNPYIKVSDIEFKLPRPSYTIDTVAYLKEKHPQHSYSIIMGSDSFQNIHKWKNADILKKENEFIVYPRDGFSIKQVNNDIEKLEIIQAPLLNISATEIRKAIKQGKSIRYFVTDKVLEEIEKGGYYK